MITIFAITDGHKHFENSIKEYNKRLGKKVTIQTIAPTKNGSQQERRKSDSKKLGEKLEKMAKGGRVIILSENATHHPSTEEFGEMISSANQSGSIIFVVGGPFGIDLDCIVGTKYETIAFGSATMPHGLALLVLIEQIYRVDRIFSGAKYHY